ncbi:MAG: ATP-binding protein [Clostridia bacterium]|nr:ATP-binding protein [Clostridia bacterium]
MEEKNIPKRILSSLLGSLSAGVVPRIGAPYIAIGRDTEVTALLGDLGVIAEGGSSMRFIIGRYGSGKSFLMQLVRGYALERGYVTCDCDLSPERKLCGGKGGGLNTYRELMKNLAIKTSPEGGALPVILSRWLSSVRTDVAAAGSFGEPGSELFAREIRKRIYETLGRIESSVGGFDLACVAGRYYEASESGDDALKSCCMRWFRGEYTTRTEARGDLGVGSIIDDDSWYDFIKLWCAFFREIGYPGFVVFIDECVNLYKITNRIGRENNYEKILSIFNDTCQGRAPGLAVIMGGTPQFLEDTRRGLFSYEALRSRLSDGRLVADAGFVDTMGPVLRLKRLSGNELLALVARLTKLHRMYYGWEPRVTEKDEIDFINEMTSRVGADTHITPREIIREYLQVLNVLYQNAKANFGDIVESRKAALTGSSGEDDLFSIDDIDI